MSNLDKFKLNPSAVLHLRDGDDELMFADGPDGTQDESRPMRIHAYGPGSKVYAKASAAQSNRTMDRIKAKGKSNQTAKEITEERAKFLAECTFKMENIEIDELTETALYTAVYSELELCFIPMQLDKWMNDTSNFTKKSPTA